MSSFLGVLNPFASRVPASASSPTHQDAAAVAGLSSSPTVPGPSSSAAAPPLGPPVSPRTSFSLAQYLSPSMGSPVPPPMQRQPSSMTTHSTCTSDSAASSRRGVRRDEGEGKEDRKIQEGEEATNDRKEKKAKKRKAPTETFVIVRPPPSNSKRPLNLQIQLVMNKPSTSASSGLSMSTSASGILPTTPDDLEDPTVESPIAAETPRTGSTEDGAQVVHITQPSPLVKSASAQGTAFPMGGATPTQAAAPRSALIPGSPGKPPVEKRARQRASTGLATGMTLKVDDANKHRKRSSTVAVQSPAAGQDADATLTRDEAVSDAESSSSEPYQTISRSTSIVSSATSFASTSTGTGRMSLSSLGYGGSASGSSKGGRRIVPMYNLAVHNVMTTVVTDAGTDTKVAKFQKRSVDISGIGSLEVVEHWSLSTNHFLTAHQQPLSAQSTRSLGHAVVDSMDGNGPSGMRGLTNGIRASLDGKTLNLGTLFSGKNGAPRSIPEGVVPGATPADAKGGNTRKLLGKIFGGGNNAKGDGANASPSKRIMPKSPVAPTFGDGIAAEALPYGAPTFGTAPILANPHATVIPPTGSRPVRYTWTIKKWAPQKGGAADGVQQPVVPGVEPGEVTLDWIRGKSARRSQSAGCLKDDAGVAKSSGGRKASADSLSTGSAESPGLEGRGSMDGRNGGAPSAPPPRSSGKKPRPTSMISSFGQDDGEDSDPEDSETPWTCIVRVPAGKASLPLRRDARDSEFRRIKYGPEGLLVGTMHPAPHHPRVVAQLKMPLELPNLLTGLAELSAAGETSQPVTQIALTEENVKDCLFVTALWLVAREEIAGIGRKKRS